MKHGSLSSWTVLTESRYNTISIFWGRHWIIVFTGCIGSQCLTVTVHQVWTFLLFLKLATNIYHIISGTSSELWVKYPIFACAIGTNSDPPILLSRSAHVTCVHFMWSAQNKPKTTSIPGYVFENKSTARDVTLSVPSCGASEGGCSPKLCQECAISARARGVRSPPLPAKKI